jgi:hypothetical protein
MFLAILETQWKWTRGAALLGFVVGFAIPLLSLLGLETSRGGGFSPTLIVRNMQQFGALYAILAGGSGLACAMLAWGHDHRGRHVYALTLPIPRSHYTAMRFGAGSLCLLLPVIGVLAGSLVGVAAVTIPTGLNAYPIALTIRFLLACFVSYAVFFAVLASSTRASAYVLGGIGLVVVVVFLLNSLGVGAELVNGLVQLLFGDRGLLSVFTGRWMLIDV